MSSCEGKSVSKQSCKLAKGHGGMCYAGYPTFQYFTDVGNVVCKKEETMKKKVFCQNCKHYHKRGILKGLDEMCSTPSNLRDTYYAPNDESVQMPAQLNKENDCKFFEKLK